VRVHQYGAMPLGAYLKSSRMLRELSLEEVATATRLPLRVVAALEADEVPDRSHAILAVRAYATAIGLDPDETALRLEEQLQRSMPPPPVPRWKRLWRARPREPLVWIVVAATVVACVALLLWRR
jgi:cytoskeletal protein RodZ